MDSQQAIVSALFQRHGRTFAAELGIDPARNTPPGTRAIHSPTSSRCARPAGLSLGGDAATLAEHVPQAEFPRLVAALVRCDRARDHAAILTAGQVPRTSGTNGPVS